MVCSMPVAVTCYFTYTFIRPFQFDTPNITVNFDFGIQVAPYTFLIHCSIGYVFLFLFCKCNSLLKNTELMAVPGIQMSSVIFL